MKYLFFVAWARAREKQIADETDFERMINSPGLGEAFKVLQDTDYAPYLGETEPGSFEELFDLEKTAFKKTLIKLGLQKRIVNLFFLRADLFNLGLLLKKELFEIAFQAEDSLPYGLSNPDKLKERYALLLENLKEQERASPSELDDFLRASFFQLLITASREMGEKGLESFLQKYFAKVKEGGPKEALENELWRQEKEFLQRADRESEGLAPLFAYWLRKEYAERALRAILSAKQLGLAESETRQLLKGIRAL